MRDGRTYSLAWRSRNSLSSTRSAPPQSGAFVIRLSSSSSLTALRASIKAISAESVIWSTHIPSGGLLHDFKPRGARGETRHLIRAIEDGEELTFNATTRSDEFRDE